MLHQHAFLVVLSFIRPFFFSSLQTSCEAVVWDRAPATRSLAAQSQDLLEKSSVNRVVDFHERFRSHHHSISDDSKRRRRKKSV